MSEPSNRIFLSKLVKLPKIHQLAISSRLRERVHSVFEFFVNCDEPCLLLTIAHRTRRILEYCICVQSVHELTIGYDVVTDKGYILIHKFSEHRKKIVSFVLAFRLRRVSVHTTRKAGLTSALVEEGFVRITNQNRRFVSLG